MDVTVFNSHHGIDIEMDKVLKVVRVFAPAPISGFFSPVITDNYLTTGAKGGGVTIKRGVNLWLFVEENDGFDVENYINGVRIQNSLAEYTANRLLYDDFGNYKLRFVQEIDVPISSGFGTSAASAYAAAIAVNRAFRLSMDMTELAYVAHEADIKFRTGLGSIAGLISPGFGIVERAGAPGYVVVRNIDVDDSYIIFAVWRNSVDKKKLLTNMRKLDEIAKLGDETLLRILDDATPETFFRECWRFALKARLASEWVRNTVSRIMRVPGVVGVTQTQIGEAVFGMIDSLYLDKLNDELKQPNGNYRYFYTEIYKDKEMLVEDTRSIQ